MNNKQTKYGEKISTYQEIGKFYGIFKNKPQSIIFYDYSKHESKINKLIERYGFNFYIAGGKYEKPDLKNKNYESGWLMIYDPSPEQGGGFHTEDQTRCWRKIHELAHALTSHIIQLKYGDGKRMGSFIDGSLSIAEVFRAVEWEFQAMKMQKKLSEEIGIFISDSDYAHEHNVNISDAVHRSIYGVFIEPELEGFKPFDKIINWQETKKIIEKISNNIKCL